MKITISHAEYSRSGKRTEVDDGYVTVSKEVERALAFAAREYRTSKAGMLGIVLAYYFGDGSNHLGCADCGFWCESEDGLSQGCKLPGLGEQTTMPLLDKGIVVVGQPVDEQVK